LTKYNFEVYSIIEPEQALREIKKITPDIIILDIMLPGIDGFEVCRRIRRSYSTPIIMLTARGEVADRIVGLELGADDYLPKPFEPRELAARLQSILRRSSGENKDNKAIFNRIEIDYRRHQVKVDEKPVELTTMEFEILSLFTKNPGIVLSRDTIFKKIKGLDADSFDRSIDVMISRLRSKLNDDPQKPQFLKTIWGTGYKFIADTDDR
jgi:DNA-binding response OmpR family regulator